MDITSYTYWLKLLIAYESSHFNQIQQTNFSPEQTEMNFLLQSQVLKRLANISSDSLNGDHLSQFSEQSKTKAKKTRLSKKTWTNEEEMLVLKGY